MEVGEIKSRSVASVVRPLLIGVVVAVALVALPVERSQAVGVLATCSGKDCVSEPSTWVPHRVPRLGVGLRLTAIRWTAFGKPTASGAGRYESCFSTGCERGAVRFIVYNPGLYRGKRVYRCMRVASGGPREIRGTAIVIVPTSGSAAALCQRKTSKQTAPRGWQSPSGNIRCGADRRRGVVACTPIRQTFAKPRGCDGTWIVVVFLKGTGASRRDGGCYNTLPIEVSGFTTLPYGRSITRHGVRCTSRATGMYCRNRSGHGFNLRRTGLTLF